MGALIDRYRGPLLATAVIAIVLLGSANGTFALFNGPVYDLLSGIGGGNSKPSQVLVVELTADAAYAGDDYWNALLDALAQYQPRQILLTTLPRTRDAALYARIAAMGMLVGRHAYPPAAPGGGSQLEEWPPDAERILHQHAVLAPPIAENGVYRYAPTALIVAGTRRLTLEVIAAQAAGMAVPSGPRYAPSFVGAGRAIARVSAARLLAGDLTTPLMTAKTLLLTPRASAADLGLYIPGALGGKRSTLWEFRAISLSALLNGDTVSQGGFGTITMAVLAVALASLYFYQRASLALSAYFTVAATASLTLVTWGSLVYLNAWIPFAELFATLIGSWIVVLNRKYVQEQTALVRELNRVSLLMQNRLVPESVLDAHSYWAQIGRMVYQLLDLKRSIFLEAIEGDHRVVEIHAIDCEITDIDERRRDYERAPYTDAIRARTLHPVAGYLKHGADGEQQFLTALMVEGRVLGFWAFGVSAQAAGRIGDLRRVIAALTEQIAELLDQRKELARQRARTHHFRDYLTLQGGHYVSNDLRQALTLSSRRLMTVEEVFKGLHTAALLYDPFGHLLLANNSSIRLLGDSDLKPFDLSYVDMLVALTGISADGARALLADVVLNERSRTLPTRLRGSAEREHLLRICALRQHQPDTTWDDSPGEAAPFSLIGILYELVDYTAVSEERHLKQTLLDRLGRSTAALQSQVEQPSLSRYLDFVQRAGNYLSRDLSALLDEPYPVGCEQVLKETVDHHAAAAAAARKQVVLQSDGDALVLASPVHLKTVIATILDFMLADTRPQGSVRVAMKTCADRVSVRFANDGIGLPEAQLARYLDGEAIEANAALSGMRDAKRHVIGWGGSLAVASEVGRGFDVTLELSRFTEPTAPKS